MLSSSHRSWCFRQWIRRVTFVIWRTLFSVPSHCPEPPAARFGIIARTMVANRMMRSGRAAASPDLIESTILCAAPRSGGPGKRLPGCPLSCVQTFQRTLKPGR